MENWRKVKDALETAGKTDSFFYVRADAILRGEKDPMDRSILSNTESQNSQEQ
jgi:hypothetical protein